MFKISIFVLLMFSITCLFSEVNKTMDISFLDKRVKVDGNLDEDFYKDLVPEEDFYQYHPKNGAKPTYKTQVYSFYDKNNIYFAFKCYDDQADKIIGDVTPFGDYTRNDEVKIYIDTYQDKRTYKVFAVNPRGILKGEDTVWNASSKKTDYGWSAEIKIPFKSLRFPVNDVQHWSINFERFIFRLNETCFWTKMDRDKRVAIFGDTFGKLEGIKNIKGGKNIEIYPYAGYRNSRSDDQTDDKFAYGVDLKYGITSNLTMDFTSSPDYSEVESDPFFYQVEPWEVNLQENRPFYNESSSYFSTPINLFYSRRISDPVLAAKITGKEKGYSLGALFAKNQKDGSPDSYHGVFRLKKDIFKLSHIGVIYSNIEEKGQYNRNYGIDFNISFKDIYRVIGMMAFSTNEGQTNSKNGIYNLIMARTVDKGLGFVIRLKRIDPNVYVPAGFVTKVDYQQAFLIGYYNFRWENKWLESVVLEGSYNYEDSVIEKLKVERSSHFIVEAATRNRMVFGLYYRLGDMRGKILDDNELVWDSTPYPIKFYNAYINYHGSSFIECGISWNLYDFFVYNEAFTQIKEGSRYVWNLWANFKISPQLQLSNSYNKTHFQSDDGTINFDGYLLSSRLNYQISKTLSTFVKFQYDSNLERFQYDFLIGYEPVNVSKIYFSIKNYSEHQFRLFKPDARSIAFKVSYLYRF